MDDRVGVAAETTFGNRVGRGGHSGGHWFQVLNDTIASNDSLYYAATFSFNWPARGFPHQENQLGDLVEFAMNRNDYEDDALPTTMNYFAFGYFIHNDERSPAFDYTFLKEDSTTCPNPNLGSG